MKHIKSILAFVIAISALIGLADLVRSVQRGQKRIDTGVRR